MSSRPQSDRPVRWLKKRIASKGLRPRYAAYVIVAVWSVSVVVFGVVEHLVDPDTFGSVWLGMWWGVETVTTVGYGDVVPQDTVGKVIAVFLMLGGLSLFAVVTGAITSSFVSQTEAERRKGGDDPVMQTLQDMRQMHQDMSAQLEQIKTELSSKR